MAKVFTTVCDDCHSDQGVERYDLRTPSGKYQIDLCRRHGKELSDRFKKLSPTGGGRKRGPRKVYELDEAGKPIIPVDNNE